MFVLGKFLVRSALFWLDSYITPVDLLNDVILINITDIPYTFQIIVARRNNYIYVVIDVACLNDLFRSKIILSSMFYCHS